MLSAICKVEMMQRSICLPPFRPRSSHLVFPARAVEVSRKLVSDLCLPRLVPSLPEGRTTGVLYFRFIAERTSAGELQILSSLSIYGSVGQVAENKGFKANFRHSRSHWEN